MFIGNRQCFNMATEFIELVQIKILQLILKMSHNLLVERLTHITDILGNLNLKT